MYMVHFKSYHSACKEHIGFLHTHTFDIQHTIIHVPVHILIMGQVLVVCKMYLLFLSHLGNTDGHSKFTVFNLLFNAAILNEFSLRNI